MITFNRILLFFGATIFASWLVYLSLLVRIILRLKRGAPAKEPYRPPFSEWVLCPTAGWESSALGNFQGTGTYDEREFCIGRWFLSSLVFIFLDLFSRIFR